MTYTLFDLVIAPLFLLDSKSFMGIIPVARQKHGKSSHEMVQGSLLNGIDKKTCRREGIEPIKRVLI